jgi:RNA polymerase sigma factor (sigma-70 family)
MMPVVGVDRVTLPDAVLVARVRAGDRDCFGVLLERHLPVVRGVCRGLLGRSAVVDDVMQEAAVEAFVKIDSLRSPERFGPWLCGIALNIARRWLRHARRERWDGTAVEEVVVIDDSPSPEEAMLAAEVADQVRAALRELPAGQRAAAWLFYLRDHSIEETAIALKTTPGAVKVRLHEARATLRSHLADLQEEPTMAESAEQLVRVTVSDVRAEPLDAGELPSRHVVLLREADGDRFLPIWMGAAEATQIAYATLGEATPRPMTYAFMRSLLDAGGVRVNEIRITTLSNNVFFATVHIRGTSPDDVTVDARPSDAINIALEASAPIYVSTELLTRFQATDLPGGMHIARRLPHDAADIVATTQDQHRRAWAQITGTEPSDKDHTA